MTATKEQIEAMLAAEFPQFRAKIESVDTQGATLRHHPTGDDMRPGGTISGPTLFSIADSALYVAVLGAIGIVPLAVTTNMTINFVRKPLPDRDLIAHCRLIKVGRSLAVGDVLIYSEGQEDPVTHAVGTYAIPPNR